MLAKLITINKCVSFLTLSGFSSTENCCGVQHESLVKQSMITHCRMAYQNISCKIHSNSFFFTSRNNLYDYWFKLISNFTQCILNHNPSHTVNVERSQSRQIKFYFIAKPYFLFRIIPKKDWIQLCPFVVWIHRLWASTYFSKVIVCFFSWKRADRMEK